MICLLEEERYQETYQVYTAQCLWSIASGLYSLGGTTFDMQQYVEIVYPETKAKELTAEEVKAHILERLREG